MGVRCIMKEKDNYGYTAWLPKMKRLSIRKMIGLVIFLVTLICIAAGCLTFGIKVQNIMCDNIFVLSFLRENKNFDNSDIVIAEKEGIHLTYVKYLYPEITNGFCKEEAAVIATNDNYFYFTEMEIKTGAFFNRMQEERQLPVVVLNEKAAYQMFGNYDCIGQNVYLDKNAFEIIGIVKERGNVEEARIYIPDRTVSALEMSCTEVNQLWCRLLNVAEVSLIISKMGYTMNEIEIIQMDLCKKIFMQRFFILSVLIVTALFISTFKAILLKVREVKQRGGISRKWVIKRLLQVVICMSSLIAVIKIIQVWYCVPPNYEVVGKDGKSIFYEVLEFYALSDIEIDNLYFLRQWNLMSLLYSVMGIIGIMFWKIMIEKIKSSFRTLIGKE